MEFSARPVVHTLERPSEKFIGRTKHLGNVDECKTHCMACHIDNYRSDRRIKTKRVIVEVIVEAKCRG
jgi:hypothetical protein